MLLIPILHFCFLRMMMRLTRIHAKNTLTMDFYAKIFACVASNKKRYTSLSLCNGKESSGFIDGTRWSVIESGTRYRFSSRSRAHLGTRLFVYLLSRILTCAREPNCPNLQISTSFYFARLPTSHFIRYNIIKLYVSFL